jgi:hypothetical protein
MIVAGLQMSKLSDFAEFAFAARLPEAAEWGDQFTRRAIDQEASGLEPSGHLLRVIYVGR